MKLLASTFLFFCLSATIYGADMFDFDLRTFTPPDYTRSSLEFTGDFSFNRTITENSRLDWDYVRNDIDAVNESTIGGVYSYYTYSQKHITDMAIELNYGYNYTFREYDESLDTDVAGNAILIEADRMERFYFSSKYFFILGAGAEFQYIKLTNSLNDDQMDRNYGFFGVLGFGWGRLEDVGYARTALFMYEDMQKYGVLKSAPDANDIRELATLIAQRKNLRSLDYRDNFVENIKTFDQFFKNKSNVTPDAMTMAAYTDVFHNLSQTQRLYGSELKLEFRPIYENMLQERYNYVMESVLQTRTGFISSVSYQYENPLSQKWQLSFLSRTGWSKQIQDADIEDTPVQKVTIDSYSYESTVTIGYYPTQRTSFSAMAGVMGQHMEAELDGDHTPFSEASLNVISLIIELDSYYYFSPNVTIFASTGINYEFSDSSLSDPGYHEETLSEKQYDLLFEAGITYKLF